ncbi:unnamed protein product [Peniophora sp. CBMAI 1063]|nr:unnamed protein product [Peniophora sp. CBMAI 1063]
MAHQQPQTPVLPWGPLPPGYAPQHQHQQAQHQHPFAGTFGVPTPFVMPTYGQNRTASPVPSDTSSRPSSPVPARNDEIAAFLRSREPEDPDGPVKRDESFYFDSLIFKAENTLFKVPRYALPAEDGIFSAMLDLPAGEEMVEGKDDDHPIVLPAEVTAFDFRSLLKATHPFTVSSSSASRMPYLTLHEWLSVVKLSTKWCLDELRVSAIVHCEALLPKDLSPIDRLVLGRELRIAEWMIKTYEEFGRRTALVDGQEREALGMAAYVKVVELRERSMRWTEKRRGRTRAQYDFRRKVQELFGDELAMDKDYKPLEVVIP